MTTMTNTELPFPSHLPALPEPPTGYRWVYRGKGWSAKNVLYISCFEGEGAEWGCEFGPGDTLASPHLHYAEAVKIEEPDYNDPAYRAMVEDARQQGFRIEQKCVDRLYRGNYKEWGAFVGAMVWDSGWVYRIHPLDAPKYKAPSSEPPYGDRAYQKSVLDAAWNGVPCQYFGPKYCDGDTSKRDWQDVISYVGLVGVLQGGYKIRIKPAEPAPVKMVPLEAGDIPAVCWVRQGDRDNVPTQIISVTDRGRGGDSVEFFVTLKLTRYSMRQLQDGGWEYSPDRKNWWKCEKPAKEGV